MTSVDITEWHPQKVEGVLTAIRSDLPGVEISVTLRSNGEQQMCMALNDERSSDCVAHQCHVCDAITVAKVLLLDGIKGRKALKALGAGEEGDTESDRTHDHRNRNGQH
jgi:hypothetical protein